MHEGQGLGASLMRSFQAIQRRDIVSSHESATPKESTPQPEVRDNDASDAEEDLAEPSLEFWIEGEHPVGDNEVITLSPTTVNLLDEIVADLARDNTPPEIDVDFPERDTPPENSVDLPESDTPPGNSVDLPESDTPPENSVDLPESDTPPEIDEPSSELPRSNAWRLTAITFSPKKIPLETFDGGPRSDPRVNTYVGSTSTSEFIHLPDGVTLERTSTIQWMRVFST